MSRNWETNVVIDGSKIREQFEDPLPVMGPSLIVTNDTANPHAAAYEVAVQDLIRNIAKTPVGRILFQQINASKPVVTIRPLNEFAIESTGAAASDGEKASKKNQGCDVTIWFDPMTWSNSVQKQSIDSQNHYRPDDVLFHELVHALRMLRGLWDPRPAAYFWDWDTVEEMYAIMFTNIYVSSINRDQDLRGDHSLRFHVLGNNPTLPANSQIDGSTFYSMFSTEIDSLCRFMPDLCHPVSQIQCRWNALRDRISSVQMSNRLFGTPIPSDLE